MLLYLLTQVDKIFTNSSYLYIKLTQSCKCSQTIYIIPQETLIHNARTPYPNSLNQRLTNTFYDIHIMIS